MTAARSAYEQVIADRPQNSLWARLALADLLIAEKKPAEAEAQLREARKSDPTSVEAAVRLARLRVEAGDMAGALAELDPTTGLPAAARQTAARDLFVGAADDLIASLSRDRKEFDEGRLARETFYTNVNQKSVRALALIKFLQDAGAPPESAPPAVRLAHRQRVLAATRSRKRQPALPLILKTATRRRAGRRRCF
jgi:predicted Zn-dependent protease